MLTSFAMGRRKYNGLIPGQTVNAHIEEAAYRQTQNGEYDYQEYFHGCLLWTYHRSEVNSSLVLLPGIASSVIASPDLSGRGNLGAGKELTPFYGCQLRKG